MGLLGSIHVYIAYIGTNMRERISSTSSKNNEFILRNIMYNEKVLGKSLFRETDFTLTERERVYSLYLYLYSYMYIEKIFKWTIIIK